MKMTGTNFFRYCPNCGSQEVDYQNNFKMQCNNCDFVLYHNIAAAVAVIFKHDNQILFTVRNSNPDKGKLDLPGGFVDPNETAEEAACREIREELGLSLQTSDLNYLTTSPNNYLYRDVAYRTMDIFYVCELNNNHMHIAATDEIKELRWINIFDIDLSQIGFISIRKVISEIILSYSN